VLTAQPIEQRREPHSPPQGAAERFRLADRTALLFTGDRKALFSEDRQKLFELNASAAYIACRLEDGISHTDLLQDLVRQGFGHAAAEEAIKALLLNWSIEGLAVADLCHGRSPAWRMQDIAIGGISACLAYQDAELFQTIAPAFAHLETAPSAHPIRYHIAQRAPFAFISREQGPAAIVTPLQAAPALKSLLVSDVLDTAEGIAALHTACLIHKGRALLLSGSPGAGKSTLTIALEAAGFAYQGDDIALLERSGKVQGVAFAATAKTGSWPLIRNLRVDVDDVRIHHRPDGKRVRYLPPARKAGTQAHPMGWVIRLNRRPGASARLAPLQPFDTLSDLLGEAYSRSGGTSTEDLDVLLRAVTDARCHELVYSDLTQAVDVIQRMCADG
jgi:hypothetical protein